MKESKEARKRERKAGRKKERQNERRTGRQTERTKKGNTHQGICKAVCQRHRVTSKMTGLACSAKSCFGTCPFSSFCGCLKCDFDVGDFLVLHGGSCPKNKEYRTLDTEAHLQRCLTRPLVAVVVSTGLGERGRPIFV